MFKGPNGLGFDAGGNLYFTDPSGPGPGQDAADKAGAVYQYSTDGILWRIIPTGSFPNGIAVAPDDGTLAVAGYASNRMLYCAFPNGPDPACAQCAKDPSHPTFFFATAGRYNPATAVPAASTRACMRICRRRAVPGGSRNTIRAAFSSASCRCRMAIRQPRTLPSAGRTTNTPTWNGR